MSAESFKLQHELNKQVGSFVNSINGVTMMYSGIETLKSRLSQDQLHDIYFPNISELHISREEIVGKADDQILELIDATSNKLVNSEKFKQFGLSEDEKFSLTTIYNSLLSMNYLVSFSKVKEGRNEILMYKNILRAYLLNKKDPKPDDTIERLRGGKLDILPDDLNDAISATSYNNLGLRALDGVIQWEKGCPFYKNSLFVTAFLDFLWAICKPLMLTTNLWSNYCVRLVRIINNNMGENYAVVRCNKKGDVNFTCGRAIQSVHNNDKATQIVFYNTDADAWPDDAFLKTQEFTGGNMNGGSYYDKYIKYKTKYLELKKTK